ncbi:hypothetical protein [Periweissella beninensis]|uniref:Uncharacterized protein n=1 Tax=Periweissella beninensis TaxID=504936 RepID=A0ABT0VK39_9LACO|nr:hypothetical protein [Periweissella beninensis]MBM7544307.1 hypothetical protein [Periweissella beninensis]MCM2437809.1 hypothetical protein [Periweissella beninensis]MCT4397032.1 hypothetical protein [Periweissella beninensis]
MDTTTGFNRELRFMLLEQYGLKKVISHPDVSENDLMIIIGHTKYQEERALATIRLQTINSEHISVDIAEYKKAKHVNGLGAARARAQFNYDLQKRYMYASPTEQAAIQKILSD